MENTKLFPIRLIHTDERPLVKYYLTIKKHKYIKLCATELENSYFTVGQYLIRYEIR
jgi:hypothetical protein